MVELGRTPQVTLAGVVIGGADSYSWGYTSGTTPLDVTWPVTAARAEKLLPFLGTEVELSFTPGKLARADERLNKTSTQVPRIYKVWILEVLAGSDPFMRRVRITDGRWLWPKKWISARLNWRRATGDTFVAGENRIENAVLPQELRYAEYSLFPPDAPNRLWTARDALEYYITVVLGTPVIWLADISATATEGFDPIATDIQDLVLEGPGDAIVAQLLALVPGLNGYMGGDGRYYIYDDRSREEEVLLAKLPAPRMEGGTVTVSDKRGLRPSNVIVMFTPEIEMRFNYVEGGSRTADTPVLANVAPSPDFLTGGPLNGTAFAISEDPAEDKVTAARGSYVELERLFTAWGSFGFFNKPVSFEALRRHATKYGFASFLHAWGNHPYEPFDGLKMARAQACASHWRRTFQIEEKFQQRLQSINSYRVSLMVPHLGVYAPSPVYCDWTRRPSYKGFATGGDPNDNQGFMVRGYNERLDDGEIAPARVHIIDPEAGLFTVEPIADPWGYTDNIWFGYPDGDFIPSQDVGDGKITGQLLYRHWYLVTLEAGWRMAVVLTVVPGSPNTNDRLWHVTVPPPVDIGECKGPPVYIRILPGVMTARFGWKDGAVGDALTAAVLGNGPLPATGIINADWVNNVAAAAAARVYDPLRDRPQGSLQVDWSDAMNGELNPRGTIANVVFNMSGGVMSAKLDFPAATQLASIWRWLDPATRKVVLRVMEHGGSRG